MNKLFVIAAFAVLVGLVGCGEDPAPPPPPAAATRKASVTISLDAGVETSPYLYSYNPIAKRDPFRGLANDDTGTTKDEKIVDTCDEPLCQFDIDELTLVAVVSGDSNPLAMVEDRTGTGHLVRRNTRMGKQGGKVTSILRDCMVVTSFVRGADGRAQPNRQNVCVKKESRQLPQLDLSTGKMRE
jgi:type IV pilus assembly protein PilP